MRAYRLAVGMARAGGQVELACPWHPGLPRNPFERDGITIRPFLFLANALPVLLGDRIAPPQLQLSIQPFTRGPRRLLGDAGRYDVVEFHFCAYGSWVRRIAGTTRVVYSAHNVELDYALAEPWHGLRRWFGRRIEALEGRAVKASDLVVTTTESDRERMVRLYGPPAAAAVVPNGFDQSDIPIGEAMERQRSRDALGLAADDRAVLFIGGRAAHNRRAVRFLKTEVLPRLPQQYRVIVAGECAPAGREGRLLALGRVERLRPLLAAADVAVNPVDTGSGSNVKLAEYLAAGIPVVTSAVGRRGYEAFLKHITVAGRDEFPAAIQASPARARRLPEVAELEWNVLGARLYRVYADMLARPRDLRSA